MPKQAVISPFRPGKIRVVCFDLNETLVAWNEALRAGFQESVEEWLGRWSTEDPVQKMTDRLWNHYLQERRSRRGQLASIQSAMRTLPIAVDEHTVSFISGRIRELQPKKAGWIEGADKVLERLGKHYRIAVVTNMDRRRTLELWSRLQMHRYMNREDLFTPIGDIRKPDRRMFHKVAAVMGEAPGRCVMVGDSYRQDAVGAVRAGWQAVWIKKGARRPAVISQTSGRAIYVVSSIQTVSRLFLT